MRAGRRFAATFAGAAVLVIAPAVAAEPLVVLVRHAEKGDDSRDPALSKAGVLRAEALAATLGGARPTHVYVTPLRRTRQTALTLGVKPVVVSLDQGPEFHVKQTAMMIRELPDDAVVVVVGHSNTIPAISAALGAPVAPMPECEYDRLITLDLRDDGPPVAVVSRYGPASACPAS